jgi:hypothetical protein
MNQSTHREKGEDRGRVTSLQENSYAKSRGLILRFVRLPEPGAGATSYLLIRPAGGISDVDRTTRGREMTVQICHLAGFH